MTQTDAQGRKPPDCPPCWPFGTIDPKQARKELREQLRKEIETAEEAFL